MSVVLVRFLNDDTGGTAIEYALLVAGIALAILAALAAAAGGISATFQLLSDFFLAASQ